MSDLIERLIEDVELLMMFREQLKTDALNRPINDLREVIAAMKAKGEHNGK